MSAGNLRDFVEYRVARVAGSDLRRQVGKAVGTATGRGVSLILKMRPLTHSGSSLGRTVACHCVLG